MYLDPPSTRTASTQLSLPLFVILADEETGFTFDPRRRGQVRWGKGRGRGKLWIRSQKLIRTAGIMMIAQIVRGLWMTVEFEKIVRSSS